MEAQARATSSEGMSAVPWLRPTSYWMPAHFVDSAWVTHGAFAAWLIDVLRPRDVVELGTHNGFSCFAFAEAAKRLGHPLTINALDSWEGDDHAGFYDDSIYQSVRSIASRDYPSSVELHRGYFSDTRPRFAAASVDLLHIDGRHGYEDAREDYEQWRDTVRDGGVILFHDIAERRDDFGVWRLWEEISEPGRVFAFEHGHGLGVLAVGDIRHEPLRALFEAETSVADRIRVDFERLGEMIAQVVDMLQTERARLSDVIVARDDALAAVHRSASWKVTKPLRAAGRMVRRGR